MKGRLTYFIVVRVVDETVLAINEDPVKAASVDDALCQWRRGVSTVCQIIPTKSGPASGTYVSQNPSPGLPSAN